MKARLALHRLLRKALLRELSALDREEMDLLVEERLRRAAERGSLSLWGCWLREMADVPRAAIASRTDKRSARRSGGPPPGGGRHAAAFVGGLAQDLGYALRSLGKRPASLLVPAAILAIGIGGTTATFSVVNALLLRPVPGIPEPDRVVELWRSHTERGGFDTFSYPDFLDLREGAPVLEELAGYRIEPFSLSSGAEGERVAGLFVSANYFRALGLRPHVGRFFLPEEDVGLDGHAVAVLGHGFWRRRFGAAPDVVGARVQLNRVTYTVVGVAPLEFGGHMAGYAPDVFVPMMQFPVMSEGRNDFERRNASWFQVLGRLAPGATPEQAEEAAKTVFSRLAEAYPESNRSRTAAVLPLGPIPGAARGPAAAFLSVLLGLVSLVLVVTSANVAGVFLARAAAREREIAVRLAVGSGRRRLVQQLLFEILPVFALGGGVGVLVAFQGLAALPLDRLHVDGLTLVLDFSPDRTVLGFALAATLVTGLGFGLLPALQATRIDLSAVLKQEPGRGGGGRTLLRRAFVSGQVGLSLVLLAAAGLFVRSLRSAAEVEAGFDPRGTWMTSVDLSMEGYASGPEARSFQERLLERVRASPEVEAAALAQDLPLDLSRNGAVFDAEIGESPDGRGHGADFNTVSEGYFEALRIPLLQGRTFTGDDRDGSERVAIVSRTLAAEMWPGASALGRRLRFRGAEAPWWTVVGVVEDVKNSMITDTHTSMVYFPTAQRYVSRTHVVARARGEPAALAAALRGAILDADPGLSLAPVVSVEGYTSLGVLPQRIAAGITGALGFLALLLSGIGIYGVVAYAVTHQTREIGIRMALGAERRRVLREILWKGVRLAAPGLLLGALLTGALVPVLRGFLLGISPLDPAALAGVAVLLLGTVVLACLVPAARASRIDPAESLRGD